MAWGVYSHVMSAKFKEQSYCRAWQDALKTELLLDQDQPALVSKMAMSAIYSVGR